ncbi:MAG: glycosyl hydrolase family 28 protein [Chitinophagaceae bacterium]|nr:glycosyl hydrolase family 28 protein [Chitinophagaceae bacterium]
MNRTFLLPVIILFAVTPLLSFARVIIYPAPKGEPLSSDYIVRIKGKKAPVYLARVSAMPVNQVWPGYQRPVEQTELASFCQFDTDEEVTVEITSSIPVRNVVVRPSSYQIRPVIKGNKIVLRITRPGQIVVEVNDSHKALHLFTNPVEHHPVTRGGTDLLYFGPGIHEAGIIHAKNNQTIYLAGGAVVHGVIYVKDASHVVIRGRGILDASGIGRFDANNMIYIDGSSHIKVEGVVLRDAHIWALMVHNSTHTEINNVKLVGHWRYNADGIDIVNSSYASIRNSFVRAFDDCIVLKGATPSNGVMKEVLMDSCVLWNDWGRAIEIGAETAIDSISDIVFQNSDIIHYVHIAMDIQNGDRAHISNVRFDNIQVEGPLLENAFYDSKDFPITDVKSAQSHQQAISYRPDQLGFLFEINIQKNNYSRDSVRGTVQHIVFNNIKYTGDQYPHSNFTGYSSLNRIKDIVFSNVFINGKKIMSREDPGFSVNEHVEHLIFK